MAVELAKKDLALKYHLLEVIAGTSVEPPVPKFRVHAELSRLKRLLRVSPFGRSHVSKAMRQMAADGLVVARKDENGPYYAVTPAGREAYYRYNEVVVLWRLEKRFGEKMELKTVNQISLRLPRQDKFHMPAVSNVKMPLQFRPVRHCFEEDREIRLCEVAITPRGR
jgi:predicted transcriptional regulator